MKRRKRRRIRGFEVDPQVGRCLCWYHEYDARASLHERPFARIGACATHRRMTEIRFPDPAEREKRSRLLEMLDQGKVMIYVDPRRPGVDVPVHLRSEVAVPLNLSHRFGLSVFDVGPLAVKASLSFGGQRYLCVLPYAAIFGYVGHADGTRVVFADALPPEVSLIS